MFKLYNIVLQAVSGKLPASQIPVVLPAHATIDACHPQSLWCMLFPSLTFWVNCL